MVSVMTEAFYVAVTAVIVGHDSNVTCVARSGKTVISSGVFAKSVKNLNDQSRFTVDRGPFKSRDRVAIGSGEVLRMQNIGCLFSQPLNSIFGRIDPFFLCLEKMARCHFGGR